MTVEQIKAFKSFNTQPPEGGWCVAFIAFSTFERFNTQPPEGGWDGYKVLADFDRLFQHTAA